jgi:hypothetical protein
MIGIAVDGVSESVLLSVNEEGVQFFVVSGIAVIAGIVA